MKRILKKMDIKNKDIVSIDNDIKKHFNDQISRIPFYENQLEELYKTLNGKLSNKHSVKIKKEIDELKILLEDLKNKKTLNLYLISTGCLINDYKAFLKVPKKMFFMGNCTNSENKEQVSIVNDYIKIASKFYKIEFEKEPVKENSNLECDNCGNKKKFIFIEDSYYVCEKCSSHQELFSETTISYKDSDRINISSKYTYDRKIHFKDCINQYQGKQNCTIEKKVYEDIEDMLEKHGMLVGNKNDPKEVRFNKVEKEHILMFLKELKYSKHYENLILIYYHITGKKPDDISYLEDKLLEDFDLLLDAYDKLFKYKVNRTNFISTQYVLYQLLKIYKHPCKKEDFIVLKTTDRKTFHDNIFRKLVDHLGWNWSG
jgi:hypothetical protein